MEDRGEVEEGGGRSEEQRGGGMEEEGLVGGALSLREEETESQPESREEDRRENSALSCHRSLQAEKFNFNFHDRITIFKQAANF